MRDLELGRLVRALRRRRGWRQEDCARRARVHRSTWSRLESGGLDGMTVGSLRRCLAVLEVKSEIVDVQALLGGLDAKTRLGASVARELQLGTPSRMIPMLLASEGATNRGRVRAVASLFERFDVRGRGAVGWLKHPVEPVSGLLVFSDLRPVQARNVKSVGSHRIRKASRISSVDAPLDAGSGAS